MKQVKVVQPYIHPEYLNFKFNAYEGWIKACKSLSLQTEIKPPCYPIRSLHGLFFRKEIPSIWKNKKTAVLMFVEPVSLYFDTFPYYATHEVIPMFWDCWPTYYDKVERWLKKHDVKMALFTSLQEMKEMKKRLPQIKMLHCPEAVNTSLYSEGKELKHRSIDLLEFGRSNDKVFRTEFPPNVNHIATKVGNKFIFDNKQLYETMGDAKITICLPKSMTHPQIAEGVETLTQRYWEAMLSRMLIVGHCPKELSDLIGYNPCIELDINNSNEQILDILTHIEEYQEQVNRNRNFALQLGDWTLRMKIVLQEIEKIGYRI